VAARLVLDDWLNIEAAAAAVAAVAVEDVGLEKEE
jgi:hypothetical protein